MKMMILILIKKALMINVTIFNSHLQIKYLSFRCVFSQDNDDWRRTVIFHTFIKIGDKNCKVIVDSESCVNTVSFKMIEKVGWKAEPRPHP